MDSAGADHQSDDGDLDPRLIIGILGGMTGCLLLILAAWFIML